jgi:outer membrane lipoprotein-sorting protein
MKSNKIKSIILALLVVFAFCSFVLSSNASKKPKIVGQKSDTPAVSPELDEVLTRMDKAAQNFKTVQADFEWDQFTEVVNTTDVQKGQLFLQRHGNDIEAGVMVTDPPGKQVAFSKQVVFKDGKVRMYEPNIDQITERAVGANKADVESFLRLGFGERGHDLLKSYQVKLDGWETIDGVKTARLELEGNASSNIRNMFSRIIWWIDPDRDVSLRQQLFQPSPSKDYRLAHYSNIKLNARSSQDFFKIRSTSKTKTVIMK